MIPRATNGEQLHCLFPHCINSYGMYVADAGGRQGNSHQYSDYKGSHLFSPAWNGLILLYLNGDKNQELHFWEALGAP